MTQLTPDNLNFFQNTVEECVQNPSALKDEKAQSVVESLLRCLETGSLRVTSPANLPVTCGHVPMHDLQTWQTHAWIKQGILLAMRLRASKTRRYSEKISYCDKFDVQTEQLEKNAVRNVYGSIVREGAYVAQGAILMPSFVNLGAWVGEGTMVDTWATVGSCAQVGKNVHIAGGVGIGGVLEPAHARPVLIGDNAFLGSRCIIVEGTIVNEGAILGANVCLTASTPLYDVTQTEKKEYRGVVPANAVVVPGTRTKEFPGGEIAIQCAYIIAYRNPLVDAKVGLNEVLRTTGLVV